MRDRGRQKVRQRVSREREKWSGRGRRYAL